MTDPEPLYHDPALARLYDGQNPWSADTDHCLGLARSASSLLDLGCGTGRFCARVAAECAMAVTGTDPAPAMLEIARARPESPRITWVLGDARTVRLGCRFDLIVMTGHAFQTLLTDADRAAGLATSAAHLSPTGRFIFDSRNPSVREWDTWTPDRTRMTFADPTRQTGRNLDRRLARPDIGNRQLHHPLPAAFKYRYPLCPIPARVRQPAPPCATDRPGGPVGEPLDGRMGRTPLCRRRPRDHPGGPSRLIPGSGGLDDHPRGSGVQSPPSNAARIALSATARSSITSK